MITIRMRLITIKPIDILGKGVLYFSRISDQTYTALIPEMFKMCELFGFSAKKCHNVEEDLKAFYSHAENNPHGWGLFLKGEEGVLLRKESIRADRSSILKELLSKGIRAKDLVAHIRLATIGYEEIANTHPFTECDKSGRRWILAHNGTIFEGKELSGYFYVQQGETDSERILLYLIDCMDKEIDRKGRALSDEERFDILDEIVTVLSPENKLNLLIFDGDILYVHSNFRDSMYMRKEEDSVSFATIPLNKDQWERVPLMQLNSFKDGKSLQTGSCHGNEYIPDQKRIDALYLNYSGL